MKAARRDAGKNGELLDNSPMIVDTAALKRKLSAFVSYPCAAGGVPACCCDLAERCAVTGAYWARAWMHVGWTCSVHDGKIASDACDLCELDCKRPGESTGVEMDAVISNSLS